MNVIYKKKERNIHNTDYKLHSTDRPKEEKFLVNPGR